MAKPNPKAYFPGCTARISYKKVDKLAQSWRQHRPYFDTWKEAHGWMLDKAVDRLRKAKAELKSAAAHHTKIMAMEAPK